MNVTCMICMIRVYTKDLMTIIFNFDLASFVQFCWD